MKKAVYILLAATMLLALPACGQKESLLPEFPLNDTENGEEHLRMWEGPPIGAEQLGGELCWSTEGWAVSQMAAVTEETAGPENISVVAVKETDGQIRFKLQNGGETPWEYSASDTGFLQYMAGDQWYAVPQVFLFTEAAKEEARQKNIDFTSEQHFLEPGESMNVSFKPSVLLPEGHYRRIWNDVSVEFDLRRD